MTEQIKHFQPKCENESKDPQLLCQGLMGLVALIESQCLGHREEIPGSKLASQTRQIGELWVLVRDPVLIIWQGGIKEDT